MALADIIDSVEGSRKTLTILNHTGPERMVDAIETYFTVQNVAVECIETPAGDPENFAVLHDGDTFETAGSVADLYEAISFDNGIAAADEFNRTTYPELLTHVDNTVFSTYDKRRMIIASREIEEAAWREGSPFETTDNTERSLYTGFQRLSLFRDQSTLYSRLADRGIDVHVHGIPDWTPSDTYDVSVHAKDDPELGSVWFVVFDDLTDPTNSCALLAEERGDNEYTGFWTYRPSLVEQIVEYIRRTWH
ncbi:MAG: DICT sensory domain-containing protein [Halobacteriales archaeon]|nr:DICT sensory domain-containing protein [Halobacteriales archaeon]